MTEHKKLLAVALLCLCTASIGANAADDANYYWGPYKEPVCNRSIWWDYGLIGVGVVTIRTEKRAQKKLGDWSTDFLDKGRKVSRVARAASVVGWASLATEAFLIWGDSRYCREYEEDGPDELYK